MRTVWDIVRLLTSFPGEDLRRRRLMLFRKLPVICLREMMWRYQSDLIWNVFFLKFHPASFHLYFLPPQPPLLLFPALSWHLAVCTSGTGHVHSASSLVLCFWLIILPVLSSFSVWGGGKQKYERQGQVVIADVVSSKHMFSPRERMQFPRSLVTIKGLPKSVPEPGLWGREEGVRVGIWWGNGCKRWLGQFGYGERLNWFETIRKSATFDKKTKTKKTLLLLLCNQWEVGCSTFEIPV